ncbi:hypothetical protein OKW11_005153 [Pseudomonas baetica]|nr:hypothetical protein [Pseudomonas baetica]
MYIPALLWERAWSGRRSDEKPESTAGCQAPRIIVDLHREQARSYRLFQVTRHKGGTTSRRYQKTGYVRGQKQKLISE